MKCNLDAATTDSWPEERLLKNFKEARKRLWSLGGIFAPVYTASLVSSGFQVKAVHVLPRKPFMGGVQRLKGEEWKRRVGTYVLFLSVALSQELEEG